MSEVIPSKSSINEPQQLPAGAVDVSTGDPTSCRVVLQEMVKGLRSGKQSRETSIVITKLQEAEMWLMESMARS